MKINLGIRGSTDAINHILLKVNDDFILQTKDNLFWAGDEGRNKTGIKLIRLEVFLVSATHKPCRNKSAP